VEMFVGVGASRVRDLFKQAKKKAPCIIFIDEIDAVGRHRGASGSTGGQDEREQTLNALLVEMDGFESKDTVILVAATNRPDVLDPALLRPGRFDRQVTISLPDVKGRLEILKVYMKNVITAKSVDLGDVARGTPGFSGAELANLVNEAALAAASQEKEAIDMQDFENAKDKILMGLERKSIILTEKEKKATAYHEAGHALVATFLPETDPLHKLSIIPRGRALGVTQQLPLDDRYTYSKTYLINKIKTLMGGRVAEEIVFNQYTTGATNDLLSATEIATKMVCEWGMNDTIGPLAYLRENESFLGGSGTYRHFSEEIAQTIDREIKNLIDQCYRETVALLKERIAMLHKLAEVLLIHETIDAYEVGLITQCRLLNQPTGESKDAPQEAAGKVAAGAGNL
jgi:cell division protease FtsH